MRSSRRRRRGRQSRSSAERAAQAARRAGAPVAREPVEQAARELIAELAQGQAPRSDPAADLLETAPRRAHREDAETSAGQRSRPAVAEWMAATPGGAGECPRRSTAARRRAAVTAAAAASPCTSRDSIRPARSDQGRLHRPTSDRRPASPRRSSRSTKRLDDAQDPARARRRPRPRLLRRATGDDRRRHQRLRPDRALAGGGRRPHSPRGRRRGLDAAALERDGQCRLWWGDNAVDLFFAYDPIHDEMRKAGPSGPFRRRNVPILGPEHLAVCKAMFDRRKDWLDIEQMLIATDDLDVAEIESWLERMVGGGDPAHSPSSRSSSNQPARRPIQSERST